MADEEAVEEGQPAATEFVPEASGKPKSNVYTVLLILAFCAFFAGSWIAGNEAYNHYDVQFFGIFAKHPKAGGEASSSSSTSTSTQEPTKTPEPPKDNLK